MRHLLHWCLLVGKLLLDAAPTQRLLFKDDDGFGEVLLTESHLHRVTKEWLNWHLLLILTWLLHIIHIFLTSLQLHLTGKWHICSVCIILVRRRFVGRFLSLVDHLTRSAAGLAEGREVWRVHLSEVSLVLSVAGHRHSVLLISLLILILLLIFLAAACAKITTFTASALLILLIIIVIVLILVFPLSTALLIVRHLRATAWFSLEGHTSLLEGGLK